MLVKKVTNLGEFGYLNSSRIRKIIISMLLSSSRDKLTLSWQNSVTDVSVGFRPPYPTHPVGFQREVSIQISINLGKTFLPTSCLRKFAVT